MAVTLPGKNHTLAIFIKVDKMRLTLEILNHTP